MAVIMLSAIVVIVPSVFAADSTSNVPFSNHVVKDTVSPAGSTLDLFDYWVQPYGCADIQDSQCNGSWFSHSDSGINKGKQLRFTYGGEAYNGQATINKWTGSAAPRKGIVKPLLQDGYPVIAGNQIYSWQGGVTDGTQSLNYLFDTKNTDMADAKKVYPNITGLLQLKNGYYTYDSTKNFASLNDKSVEGKSSYDMTLYDMPAVRAARGSAVGEFFPFNSATDVFSQNTDGSLSNKVDSMNAVLNHYFGVHSQAEFMQPVNGTINGEAMAFDFQGDDDVWLFIDGVLVGDVGGIHDSASLYIDFQTGSVKVKNSAGNATYTDTTIRQMFADAYGEDSDEFKSVEWSSTNPSTFSDGSYHTLDFFYLERGNNQSNLKLKYNLADIPENNLVKLDQSGNRVAGAGFELYKAGSDYSYSASGLISKGVTGKDGTFTFTNYETGKSVNFADLARNGRGITHYVLKETSAPPGYRKSPDIRLRYQISETGEGVLLCNEESGRWDSGAWSVPNMTLTVSNGMDVYDVDGKVHDASQGKVFAVILHRNETEGGNAETDTWNGVTGNALTGWSLSENKVSGMDSVVDLAQSDANKGTSFLHFFGLDSEGKYSTKISSLPGDIFTYYFMRTGTERMSALYTVGLYYTTADSTTNINGGNTVRLDTVVTSPHGSQFIRKFGVQVAITDVRNAPIVQKVDDAGNPVTGAMFGLYAANQVSADGKTLLEGAKPLQTCVTEDTDYPYHMDGSCMFAMKGVNNDDVADSGVDLANGDYYVKELEAPAGYDINESLAHVRIADDGIFADAGTEDDGISTMTHIGALNEVLKQFAANRDINHTLSDLKVTQLRCADQQCVDGDGWQDALDGEKTKAVDVTWAGDFDNGYYTLKNQSNMTDNGFVNATGWTYYRINQVKGDGKGTYFTLKDSDLAHLFTGANVIRVADNRKASLTLTKKVTVADGYDKPDNLATQRFRFKVTLNADDAAKLRQDGKTDYYHGSISSADDEELTESVVMKLQRASETATSGTLVRCVAIGDTDDAKCATTEPIGLTNHQSLAIDNIANGVTYTITETDLPKGYVFDSAKSSNLTGTITRAKGAAQAVVGNVYQPNNVTLTADKFVKAVKTVNGLKTGSAGSYPFEFKLQATQSTPLPSCLVDARLSGGCSVSDVDGNGNHVMRKTLTYQASSSTGSSDALQSMTFGDITFTKPGTYRYVLSETTPTSGALEGFNYSRAQYAVTVEVTVDNGDLKVARVTTVRTYDDAGAAVAGDDANATVLNNEALFTNAYSKDPRVVIFSATKRYKENGYPYHAGMFSAKLTPVGSFATADGLETTVTAVQSLGNAETVPMPAGVAAGSHVDVPFDDFHTADFPQISFDSSTGHNTYVYRVTENGNTVPDAGTAMSYDATAYYVFVAVTVDDGLVTADITYYQDVTGTLEQVTALADDGNPMQFNNAYNAESASATPKGVKTLTGRDRKASDSFSFTLKAGDDATQQAVLDKAVVGADCGASQAACTTESVLASATSTGVTAAAGESRSFDFTQLTFNAAGTYVFNMTETKGAAGGITYDTHTSTVTYVVSDMDETGKHVGVLKVQSVTYANRSALTDGDRADTAAAAFTNAYHASLKYVGFDVVKELNNKNANGSRALYAGEFTFRISGVDELSRNRIAAATFAEDREFSNGDAAATENKGLRAVNVMRNKLSDLVFNESDAGKTYEFNIVELAQHTNPDAGRINAKPDSDYKRPTTWGNKNDVKIDGVWCKQWIYHVRIAVADKGDGTLHVLSTAFCEKSDGGKTQVATADGNTRFGQRTILFTNTYEKLKPTVITTTADSAPLYKQLDGRAWTDNDQFEFNLEKCNYSANLGSFSDSTSISCTTDDTVLNAMPMPSAGASVTVGKHDLTNTKDGDFAKIGFGAFSFSTPGAYVYKVTEIAGTDSTLSYATNVRYLRFRVEENQMKGMYSVVASTPGYDAPTVTDSNDGAAFVNVCKSAERLPLTGGLTTRNFLIGGLVIGLLAVFAGFAVHEWWERQKRKEQLLE